MPRKGRRRRPAKLPAAKTRRGARAPLPAARGRGAGGDIFRRIVEESVVGIFHTTAGGKYVLVNPALARMLGYASPAVLMAAPGGVAGHYADPAERAAMTARIAREGRVEGALVEARRRDGTTLWLSLSSAAQKDARGRVTGYVGSAMDVSEMVRARDALTHAMRRIEAANEAKTTFLANMSHELRTPLNAIIGFAEVLRDARLGPADAGHRQYAQYIWEAGGHLLSLVNDVLDMARLDIGHLSLTESTLDLGALVTRQAALMSGRAREHGVALKVSVAPGFPPIRGDPVRLRQIVLNLLSNAIKFTARGGRIELRVERAADGRPALVVADNGIGMSPEEVGLALKPFYQVESGASRKHEGVGLGLPIADSLVKLHGGEIEIDSARGRGTTVRALLPSWRAVAG